MKRTTQNTGVMEHQIQRFQEGTNYRSYEFFGAHPAKEGNQSGYIFRVWAPNAQSVSVVCDANQWDVEANMMIPVGDSGIWEAFIAGVSEGMCYKYHVVDCNGYEILKCDPYGYSSEKRPHTASVIARLDKFKWQDGKWLNKRAHTTPYDKPVNIYEIHAGSWKRSEELADDGSEEFYNFRELADQLIPYLKELGYTHVELMPVAEHPYDASWGYQVIGYYSISGRYGSPEDFMYFVDEMHKNDLGVIMDWVPAHFPKDGHGLAKFDGTCLYEYQDPRVGEHKEWGTLVFDFGKNEIVSFLVSNAYYWFDKFHVDGLRVDAVSSMLYRDYSRQNGEWIPNKYGGRENLEAVKLLQTVNKTIFADFPNILMVAEESTAWPLVTKPVDVGGLGFNYKWNMGWMNDILKYMSIDPFDRKYCHKMLTFSMMYAFAENYILPLSHDEVVHGKSSMLNKMFGEYEERFASLRALYCYVYAHPGKKLTFMGNEFAQFDEWKYDRGLDWEVLEYDSHKKLLELSKTLNQFYQEHNSLWQIEDSWDGFQWINPNDSDHNVISFVRVGKKPKDRMIFISNFANAQWDEYRIGVPDKGTYRVMLNSDDKAFGGNGTVRKRTYKAEAVPADNCENSIVIKLPPLSAVFLQKEEPTRKPAARKAAAKKAPEKKTQELAKSKLAEDLKTKPVIAPKKELVEEKKTTSVVKTEKKAAAPVKATKEKKEATAPSEKKQPPRVKKSSAKKTEAATKQQGK